MSATTKHGDTAVLESILNGYLLHCRLRDRITLTKLLHHQ